MKFLISSEIIEKSFDLLGGQFGSDKKSDDSVLN